MGSIFDYDMFKDFTLHVNMYGPQKDNVRFIPCFLPMLSEQNIFFQKHTYFKDI